MSCLFCSRPHPMVYIKGKSAKHGVNRTKNTAAVVFTGTNKGCPIYYFPTLPPTVAFEPLRVVNILFG